jgi:hypothetical protein
MNKYVLKNTAGFFFVDGKGFTATSAKDATVLNNDQADCTIACSGKLGIVGLVKVVAVTSFAVVYIRKDFLVGSTDGVHGTQKPTDKNLNQVDPSKRRFATRDEALHHGSRFPERRANKGDKPGTAGHIGYYVVETNDPVNSAVNWKSGLTNSIG